VYELAPLGQALEKTLLELGKWGSQFVPPSWEGATLLHLGSYALTPKTLFRPEMAQGVNETYELRIGDEVLQVHIEAGEIDIQTGETRQADAVFHTDMPVYMKLLLGQLPPDEAIAKGLIRIEGDPGALRRFLRFCGLPSPQLTLFENAQ
jgi:putative sterol carrier protein